MVLKTETINLSPHFTFNTIEGGKIKYMGTNHMNLLNYISILNLFNFKIYLFVQFLWSPILFCPYFWKYLNLVMKDNTDNHWQIEHLANSHFEEKQNICVQHNQM